jgi:ubiquinone biosynthesis protein
MSEPALLRHHARYREIISVFSKHGFAWLIEEFGLAHSPLFRRIGLDRGPDGAVANQPAQVRMALEELGTTFIKLGQILSMRDDLVPPAYAVELSKLRENAPAVSVDEIVPIIEAELGQPIDELFATFSLTPLAAASIGQVHTATLPDGAEVAVKVMKPGVEETVSEDLAILGQLASWADKREGLDHSHDFSEMLEEFAYTLRGELDFRREGRNADRFRTMFAKDDGVIIPTVHWDHTSARVVTYQRLDGVRIDNLAELDRLRIDREVLARRDANMILKQVFEAGFYHADPHPGNFAVDPDGRIIVYDTGMVGMLNEDTRRNLLQVLSGVATGDVEQAVDGMLALGMAGQGLDPRALSRDMQRMLDQYGGLQLSEMQFGAIASDMMSVVRRNRLRLPGNIAQLFKTLAMHESTVRLLQPDFDLYAFATPYVRRAAWERLSPKQLGEELLRDAMQAVALLSNAPRRLNRMLLRLESGDLGVSVRVNELDTMMHEMKVLANRLMLAWLIGASCISLSILLLAWQPAWLDDWGGLLFWLGVGVTLLAMVVLGVRARRI